jgi:hypothetical protein
MSKTDLHTLVVCPVFIPFVSYLDLGVPRLKFWPRRPMLTGLLIFPSVRAQGLVSSYFSAWSVLLACIPHGHGFVPFPACLTFAVFDLVNLVSCCEHLVNLFFFLVQQESTLFILSDQLLSPQF